MGLDQIKIILFDSAAIGAIAVVLLHIYLHLFQKLCDAFEVSRGVIGYMFEQHKKKRQKKEIIG